MKILTQKEYEELSSIGQAPFERLGVLEGRDSGRLTAFSRWLFPSPDQVCVFRTFDWGIWTSSTIDRLLPDLFPELAQAGAILPYHVMFESHERDRAHLWLCCHLWMVWGIEYVALGDKTFAVTIDHDDGVHLLAPDRKVRAACKRYMSEYLAG